MTYYFVGNILPPITTKRNLKRLFKFAGKVVFVDILREDCVTFIRFEGLDTEKLTNMGVGLF